MLANRTKQIVLGVTAQTTPTVTVGASTTSAVSNRAPASSLDALNGVIDITVSAITSSSGAIVAKLQDSMDGLTWNAVKSSAAITTTGVKTIRWNCEDSTDQAYLPLRPFIRVVVTTGASDSITVSSVLFATKG